MDSIVIKKSSIHGRGVFAKRNFRKGEVVLRWNFAKKISKADADKLSKHLKKYVSKVGKKYVLMKPPERYVNHSCEANTYVRKCCDIAKRFIKKGEEITTDYFKEKAPYVNIKCRCGSKTCKKRL